MEIFEDDGKDTEVDANRSSGVCSESRDHQGLDNNEPDLEEKLSPEYQIYPNDTVGDLYNQLGVEKDYYDFKRIVDH